LLRFRGSMFKAHRTLCTPQEPTTRPRTAAAAIPASTSLSAAAQQAAATLGACADRQVLQPCRLPAVCNAPAGSELLLHFAGDYANVMVFTAPVLDLPYSSGDKIARLFNFVVPATYDNLGWSRISLMVRVMMWTFVQLWGRVGLVRLAAGSVLLTAVVFAVAQAAAGTLLSHASLAPADETTPPADHRHLGWPT
jgi:hypothetical protein